MPMGMATGQGWAGHSPQVSQTCRDCGQAGQSSGELDRLQCHRPRELKREPGPWAGLGEPWKKKSASSREEPYQKINMLCMWLFPSIKTSRKLVG